MCDDKQYKKMSCIGQNAFFKKNTSFIPFETAAAAGKMQDALICFILM